MNQLSQQLLDEIDVLEVDLRKTEDKILATRWTAALLDPFEAHEATFEKAETSQVVAALHQARNQLGVNSNLAGRIDAILLRLSSFLEPNETDDQNTSVAPGVSPTTDIKFDGDEPDVSPAIGAQFDGDEPDLFPPANVQFDGDEPRETLAGDNDASRPVEFAQDASEKSQPESVEPTNQLEFQPKEAPTEQGGYAPAAGAGKARSPVDIFSDRISLDDMLACLDVNVPEIDRNEMQQKLQYRQQDGVIQALQNHDQAEGRYILLPRLKRMVLRGQTVPVTLKNLVKAYPRLFGNIHDLVPYRGEPLIDSDTPQAGWAIIPHESPPETLRRTYSEQNQCMRIMGPGVGLPSHTVRRRTLVEAVYDMIVCRLVLNVSIQHDTADWTASGTSKKSFSSVYSAEEGIRIRDLAGETRHGFLGCCPTW